ncbi:hypothetical protein EXS71_03240 [Candidatus Uhrbacteria bacterium]|nr:hypothetical protein [Candidatus Uhrbacteria bacterium]
MVTLDEYDHVQKLLGKRGKPRAQKREFAFTGFVRCGECGCLYTAETKTKHIKSTGKLKTYNYYHCTWKRRDMRCTQRTCITEEALTEQMEKELAKITILPQFRTWALESLGIEHEREVKKRSTIFDSLQKTLADTYAQLDNLTRMRVRDLIDDSQYTKERDRLKLEIENLQGEIKKTESRAERWLELTEQVFDFATYAHNAFLKGNLQVKREIMLALGSNPTIIDGKLRIEPHKWFVPIVDAYPAIESLFQRFEPAEKGYVDCKTDRFEAVGSTWLRGWGSNPRPID